LLSALVVDRNHRTMSTMSRLVVAHCNPGRIVAGYDLGRVVADYDLGRVVADYDLGRVVADYDLGRVIADYGFDTLDRLAAVYGSGMPHSGLVPA
jgi:hypothetical protein